MSDKTTSNVPTWQSEFDNRIKAFATAIGVAEERVREILSNLGVDGKSEQSLTIIENNEFLPMADLFEAFVDSKITAKSKLRVGMPHLRGSTHLGQAEEATNGSVITNLKDMFDAQRPLTSMTDSELLDRYDDTSTEVWKILRERTHGRFCIVYNKDQSVNKEVSLKLIRSARKQVTPDKFEVNSSLVRVRRAGEFPAIPLEESPFFPCSVLFEKFCTESNTNWDGISHELRVLAHLVAETDGPLSKYEMRDICRDAKSMTVDEFRLNYTNAALLYDEMDAQGTLPDLKVRQGNSSTSRDTGF